MESKEIQKIIPFDDLWENLDKLEERLIDVSSSNDEYLSSISQYLIKAGGKRFRPLISLLAGELGTGNKEKVIDAGISVELIHLGSLYHDDVIDEGTVRRGKETLNKVWDNHSSVLIGDYLLSRCFEMMVEDGNLEVLKLLSSTSSKIAQGEVLQLQHKGEVDMLEETYLKIITAKTAELFAAATKVGAILSDAENKEKEALEFYGRNLGLTFQIADDTLDYNAELKLFGKKIGQDFFEGKITLPIILLFQKLGNDEKKILSNMFKKELRTKDDFNEIIALINKYKIIQECYQKAQHYINLASNSLSVFKDSEEKNILKRLTSFSLSRNF